MLVFLTLPDSDEDLFLLCNDSCRSCWSFVRACFLPDDLTFPAVAEVPIVEDVTATGRSSAAVAAFVPKEAAAARFSFWLLTNLLTFVLLLAPWPLAALELGFDGRLFLVAELLLKLFFLRFKPMPPSECGC